MLMSNDLEWVIQLNEFIVLDMQFASDIGVEWANLKISQDKFCIVKKSVVQYKFVAWVNKENGATFL